MLRVDESLAVGGGANRRLHIACKRVPVTERVPAPDPEAIPQGVTRRARSSEHGPQRPQSRQDMLIQIALRPMRLGVLLQEVRRGESRLNASPIGVLA